VIESLALIEFWGFLVGGVLYGIRIRTLTTINKDLENV